MLACFDQWMYWRGFIHDTSKFFPSEFIPYARFFHNKDGSKKTKRDKTGFYKPTDTGNKAFEYAWNSHSKRNRHHWQYWVTPREDGTFKVLNMPPKYIHEMVCDWIGAGRAQGVDNWKNPWPWYEINKDKIILSVESRYLLETIFMPDKPAPPKGDDSD
jgi:hypothetical protein